MKLTRPSRCVSKLRHGEVKRIPTSTYLPLVGYYMGCPTCGRPNPILGTEQTFSEVETLSMGPGYECMRCHKKFRVVNDEVEVVP